jgi:hypothetical protein
VIAQKARAADRRTEGTGKTCVPVAAGQGACGKARECSTITDVADAYIPGCATDSKSGFNAYAIQYSNGVPQFGYFVSTSGTVQQVLPPSLSSSNSISETSGAAVATAADGQTPSVSKAGSTISAQECRDLGALICDLLEVGVTGFGDGICILLGLAGSPFAGLLCSLGFYFLGKATGKQCPKDFTNFCKCVGVNCGSCGKCIAGKCEPLTCDPPYVCQNGGCVCPSGSCSTTMCLSGYKPCGTICCPPGSPCSNGACSGPCINCNKGELCCFNPINQLYGCAPVGYHCCPGGGACAPDDQPGAASACCTGGSASGTICCTSDSVCCSISSFPRPWCCRPPDGTCGSQAGFCCSLAADGTLVCTG